ncbi:glycosyltransferase family 1 protein [Lactobacillus acidophilus]|uniref:glycosyltransferase family 1 protein n=1 Tax=Lactobacillus acidophilus TaxID=1579 RepID=UPI000F76401B|nr:glycosyltransferase family 1 protein [Lactobacillus acidophilus]AZN77304.1 glycosyltransferase family 1 protein [Lactobacillus acidophilus]
MYKVLVFGMTSNPGGVETFLMSYYRKLNKQKVQFDFLCNTHEKIAYEQEIKSMGGQIFKVSMRSKHPVKYKKELKNFFKKNAQNYDCIWVNVNSLANIDYLKFAKKYGIKRRIIHSHNSKNMDSYFRGLLHKHNKKNISKYATDFWAASKEAAKWSYPLELMDKVVIIKNAIEPEKFEFNLNKRKLIRKKWNLENDITIGNIGRLHFQKNQEFAIDVLNKLLNYRSNYKLVLVGQGPDESKLKNKVKKLHLEDKVIFTGVQHNIDEWLDAFDIFIFPSIFEGLGIAGLEAEANGLPVFASKNVIPSELRINKNFEFISLNNNPQVWAEKMYRSDNRRERETQILNNFKNSGFDINEAIIFLEKRLSR